jgi:hypothetical protein
MDSGLALWAPRNDEGLNKLNRIYHKERTRAS